MAGRSASLSVMGCGRNWGIPMYEYDGTGDLEYTGILWDMTQSLKLRRVHSWKKINSSLEVVTLMLTMKQFLNHWTDTSG